jgi:hypothetical protein
VDHQRVTDNFPTDNSYWITATHLYVIGVIDRGYEPVIRLRALQTGYPYRLEICGVGLSMAIERCQTAPKARIGVITVSGAVSNDLQQDAEPRASARGTCARKSHL